MPSLPQAAAGSERPLDRINRAAYVAGRALGRARVQADRLPVPRPWMVLGALVVCNWLVILEAARIALHQGWLYSDGGSGTWYYTSAWVLGHGHIPLAAIGYVYSLLIAPLALIAGPNLLAGLPLVVFFNAIVLSPIALLCVYALCKAIGGVRFAYPATLFWVVAPLLAIRYFLPDYHTRYVDVALPAAVGLTAGGDFPSMVCLLVAACFCYRALSSRSGLDALSAGLATGLAIGIEPASAAFLPAPLLALAVARRPRELALLAAGIAPSLVALALWKYRGLGYLPAFSSRPLALAAGVGASVPPIAFSVHLGQYIHFGWGHYKANLDGLREFGWSKRLVEWLAFGGLIGLARRSLSGAVLVGVWFFSYLFLKGGNSSVSFNGGTVFTHLLPGIPAYLLLAACAVFLVPVYGRRMLPAAATTSWPRSERSRRGTLAVLAFLAVVPIGVILLLPPLTRPAAADLQGLDLYIPADRFPLSARSVGGAVILSWPRQQTHGAHASYFVFRTPGPDSFACAPVAHAASRCAFNQAITRIVPRAATSLRDRPGPGEWTYRVALAAISMGTPAEASPLLLSAAATVRLRG
jgi:hypothetical protein